MTKKQSQIETDQNIINFLGDIKVKAPQDLVVLKDLILNSLESRPYNKETKDHADSLQWKRTPVAKNDRLALV